MRKFEYCLPTEIVFGENTESKVGTLIKKYHGTRIFVVYGTGSAKKSGLLDKIENILKQENLEYKIMGGVVPNPLLSTTEKMIKEAIDFKTDFILGVGGGSVIDTAKAIGHGVANPEVNLWDFFSGKAKIEKTLPVGVILTISAAGSETSNSCVITNDYLKPNSKRGITSELQRPKFAILNPELTMTLPKYQIGAGVTDIFMHTSERFFTNILDNHLTDEIAIGLFRNIIHYGQIGYNDPNNYEAMSEIMYSGTISHSGLTGIGAKGDSPRDGDWACHQLGMAISALYNSTHGATLSAVFSTWAKYVMKENISRFAYYSRRVFDINEIDDEKAALEGIDKTNDFFKNVGMPTSISELIGHTPTEKELSDLAIECTYGKTRKIGSFKVLDYDDILEIYKRCK